MMGVTPQTNAANVASASNLVAIDLGIDTIGPGNWTSEQRISFLRGLSQSILKYPAEFDDETTASAQMILAHLPQGPVETAGFWDYAWADGASFGELWDYYFGGTAIGSAPAAAGALLKEGVKAFADSASALAKAASNTAAISQYALPIAFVLGLYFLARSVGEDPAGTATKAARGAVAVGKDVAKAFV